ncbi:MAG: 2-oxo-4-hydroxy-4-carboxy-5-ureidoimidazoline decarboxylase [Verrucomicrobiota bacterium]|jgi:2-oxo-4-hydroxy-4-carboxy-5-ureidoimidazoline decarboxylase
MPFNLSTLNVLPAADFVRAAGPLFEHSPWIAERAAAARPFATLEAMHQTLVAVVAAASNAEQVGLIAAHPDLAGKLAVAGLLTADSTAEQKTARLDRLSPADFTRITALNDAYRAKFDFPFVICVRDHTQAGIFEAFEQRVANSREAEIKTALAQIARIAWHRLQALVAD